MRPFFVCICLVLGNAISAWAEPVYFIVDASRSMNSTEHEEALAFIKQTKDALPADSQTSTTVFGSTENGGDCGAVSINDLRPAAEDILGEFERGNHTPLGEALRVALEKAAITGGRVVAISDGADTCEVNVCEVIRQHMQRNPKAIRPSFEPIGASDDTVDTFGCFLTAAAPVQHQSIIPPPPDLDDRSPMMAIGGLLAAAIMVLTSVALGIQIMRAKARDLQKQIDALDPKKLQPDGKPKATNPEVTTAKYIIASLPASIAIVLVLVFWLVAPTRVSDGVNWVWYFVNLPSGSMLLPAAFLGFGGWALLEGFNTSELQRQLKNSEFLTNMEQERKEAQAAIARQKIEERARTRREREEARRAELMLRIAELRDIAHQEQQKKLETKPELSRSTSQKLIDIADKVESVISEIKDMNTLEVFSEIPRTDYRPILQRLHSRRLIGTDVYGRLLEIFGDWCRYMNGEDETSSSVEASVLDIDLSTIRRPTSFF